MLSMNAIARAPGPARLLRHASDDADDLTGTIEFSRAIVPPSGTPAKPAATVHLVDKPVPATALTIASAHGGARAEPLLWRREDGPPGQPRRTHGRRPSGPLLVR
jgi:hypothetical protein